MAAVWPDIEIRRGDTPTEYYKLFDGTLATMPLNGVTVWFTVKPDHDSNDTDSSAILKHHIAIDSSGAVTSSAGFSVGGTDPDSGLVVSTVESGVLTHTIPQADSTVMAPAQYIYDIQVKDAAGRYETIIEAKFTVTADVTRRITTP